MTILSQTNECKYVFVTITINQEMYIWNDFFCKVHFYITFNVVKLHGICINMYSWNVKLHGENCWKFAVQIYIFVFRVEKTMCGKKGH